MLRSPGGLRAKALLLLVILLIGGFGLPVTDALVFHSATGAAVPPQDELSGGHDTGKSHLLGCAAWSSPATSTGLPGVPVALLAPPGHSLEPHPLSTAVLSTQNDLSLALSRAPPVA